MTNQDLQQIDELLQKRLKGFATKDDLRNLATKDDLKTLVTNTDLDKKLAKLKDDLENTIGALGRQLHEDLAPMDEFRTLQKEVEEIREDLRAS